MNPWNPEAGDTPAPSDAADRALSVRASDAMWRAWPYFAFRYGERGRAFGRSDTGYLATLGQLPDDALGSQLAWLARLLSARGMPSLLLEQQVELLGRQARRAARPWAPRILEHAARMREQRMAVLSHAVFTAGEAACRAAAHGLKHRRGAGTLIAGAVADRALGFGEHDAALVEFLANAGPADASWRAACEEAHQMAVGALGRAKRIP